MKKTLLLFSTLIFAFNLSAQNYDSDYYLRQAYSALEEGKIEVAQSSYNVYKNATGKTDVDFETLLKDKSENDWTKSCHIIDLGNGEYLAAQKQYSLTPVWFDAAYKRSKVCRLGGFDDWRLPTEEELYTLFFVENFITSTTYFWIYYYVEKAIKKNEVNIGKVMYVKAINVSGSKLEYRIFDSKNEDDKLYVNDKPQSPDNNGILKLPSHYYVIVRRFKK